MASTTDSNATENPKLNSDVQLGYEFLLAILGSLLILTVLLMVISGCIYFLKQRCKRRQQRQRNNTISVFDLATIFDDSREPYAALRARGTRPVGNESTDSTSARHTHGYAELILTDMDSDYDKSEEQLNTESIAKQSERNTSITKPEPPRKCNTLSGILLRRLGGNRRRNERSTLQRYLTTRRESSASANDYVDANNTDDITGFKTLPHFRNMASRRGEITKDSFVPEDDNLWARCSSDGSLEHDVTMRQVPEGQDSTVATRHSVMSDLLRSSWMNLAPRSEDQDYRNLSIIGSQTSLTAVEGVFIPEEGSDHPLREGAQNTDHLSQNLIDMISERFASNVQRRESDSYEQKVDLIAQSLPLPQASDPFVKQYFSESQQQQTTLMSKGAHSQRVNSVTPPNHDETFPEVPRGKNIPCETFPRTQRRPLPPFPQKKQSLESKHNTTSSPPSITNEAEVKGSTRKLTSYISGSSPCNVPTVDYQNAKDHGRCLALPSASTRRVPAVKDRLPPPTPPKVLKPKLAAMLSSDAHAAGNASSTGPSAALKPNFLKLAQQLQETLAMRLPSQAMQRKPDRLQSTSDSE